MPRTLSLDIRERVIAKVEGGYSRREAAEQLEISPSAAIKLLQLWTTTGSAEAKPKGGSVSPLDEHAEDILAIFAGKPDMTLAEAAAEIGKRVIKTSVTSVFRFCERHRVTFKKNTTRRRARAARRGRGKTALDQSPRFA